VRHVNRQIIEFARKSATALAAQHGGVLKHGSVKDIVRRLASAVDVATSEALWSQLAGMHAVQNVSSILEIARPMEDLDKVLDELLAAVGARSVW
jgi:hypothetical protein